MLPGELHQLTSGPIGTAITAIGLLGNSLSILTWLAIRRRLNHTSSTVIFFILLGIVDSCFLLSFFLSDSLPALLPHLKQSHTYTLLFSYILYPVFFFFLVLSIWVIVAMTADRFALVVRNNRFSNRWSG